MSIWTLVAIGVPALWLLANLKTSRADGSLLRRVHPYRTLMAYIMPTRTESVVYLDSYVGAEALQRYLEGLPEQLEANITHCAVAAAGIALAETPAMNRFVVGRRFYQRRGIFVSFSAKRKKLDPKAKLTMVKLEIDPDESFAALCARMERSIGQERSGERTYADREFDFFRRVPRPLLAGAVRLLRWLDSNNLLPPSFIENDALYTSMIITNLGSIGMPAVYHHLFEWGNCPAFMMVGRIEERPTVEAGEVVARPMLPLRWAYDERIDDGLTAKAALQRVEAILADPERFLGCAREDGSDTRPLVAGNGGSEAA